MFNTRSSYSNTLSRVFVAFVTNVDDLTTADVGIDLVFDFLREAEERCRSVFHGADCVNDSDSCNGGGELTWIA